MLGLIPFLVPTAVIAVSGLCWLILLFGYNKWFSSWAASQPSGPKGLIGRITGWTLGRVRAAVKWATKRLATVLSNAVAASSGVMVRALNNATEIVLRSGTAHRDTAAQTYRALWTLRHVTLTNLLNAQMQRVLTLLNPIRVKAETALQMWTDYLVDLRGLLRAIDFGGVLITTDPVRAWTLSYRHIWQNLFGTVIPRLNQVRFDFIPDIFRRLRALETAVEQSLPGLIRNLRERVRAVELQIGNVILPRLSALEAILAPAALAALIAATMRTVAPNLFCRNTQRATQELCKASPGLLDDILALGLPILVWTDLCTVASAVRAAANGFAPVLHGLVAVAGAAGNCSDFVPPPALPLNATRLPASSGLASL